MLSDVIRSYTFRIIWILAKRVVTTAIYKYVFYIAISIMVLGMIIPISTLGNIQKTQDVIVAQRPLEVFILIAGVVIAIYLALYSLITISQEFDSGTIEVLFFGPISPQSYLLGNFLGQWSLGAILLTILGVYLLVISQITGLFYSWHIILSLFVSWFSMTAAISSGILFSVLIKNIKKAIILFISIIILFVGIQIGYSYYQLLINQGLESIKIINIIIQGSYQLTEWLSPIFYFFECINRIRHGDYLIVFFILIRAILFASLLLGVSAYSLKSRGVHP